MDFDLSEILMKQGHSAAVIERFREEKVTANIVSMLSIYDFKCLGIVDKADIMKLRVECVCYRISNRSGNAIGRTFEISRNMIESLFETGYSVKDASRALGVSESTLYRKMRQYSITKLEYTEMDDGDLDDAVFKTISDFPRCGEEMLRKILLQKDIKIQRWRLRECLHRIDSEGISERKRKRLRRRTYSVANPNYIWHIDTNHKLIRWHFVILGGVDGFSRLITYLKCATNNKADTILQCFQEGVSRYGIPERVRSDQGRENISVAEFMIQTRGTGSMLTGKSTHNQRIERLWRDVYDGVLGYFYDLFYYLEDEGLLDVLNELHLIALHHVFLSKINERLATWQGAWNHHRLRTVNSTPMRLFTGGMINNPAMQFEDITQPVANTISESDIEEIVLEDNRPVLSSLHIDISNDRSRRLNDECPQNWISENHGVEIFVSAKQILTE